MSTLLISHPGPYATESLSGYVLRLSGLNGYMSPWSVLKLAGFQQGEMTRSDFDFERLSKIINWSARNAGPLRNQFLVPELHAKEAKFCPECVVAKGFIEAHWSLPLMVACPEHNRTALFYCPKCTKRIRWYRPGLLECECGRILSDFQLPHITASEATLLDLIRRKVLRYEIPNENLSGLPLSDLWDLDLPTLLRVIQAMAKHSVITGWSVPVDNAQRAVTLAAQVLQNWPTNFIALLKEFAQKQFISEPKTAVSKCKEIYRPLFADFANATKKNTDFILSVLIEYAANEWDYRDAFQMKRFQDRLPTGLLSSREFDLQLEAGTSLPARYPDGGRKEIVLEKRATLLGQNPVDIIGLDLAANRLGLSPILFRAIVESGFCKSCPLPSSPARFSQEDLDAFKQNLLGLAKTDNRNLTIDQCVSLQAALSWNWDSIETKVELVRALLDKKIEIVASFGDSVGGLQMDRAAYHRFMVSIRERSMKESVSATEAAKALQCDRTLIPGLVRFGALHGSDLPTGLRIDKVSLDDFKRNYVFVIEIAKNLHTNTAKLARYCDDKIGIPVTWPKRGSRDRIQPYIRSEDAKRVIEIISAARAAKQMNRSPAQAADSKSPATEWRYWEMAFPGSPLRRRLDAQAATITQISPNQVSTIAQPVGENA